MLVTVTNSSSTSSGKLTFLRAAAGAAALGSIVSPLLALGPLTASGPLHGMHGMVGNINALLALLAAVAGFLWFKASGNKGLMYHGISLPVLAVIQIALGEMHIELLHIILGFAYLLSAVALFTLSLRRPTGSA